MSDNDLIRRGDALAACQGMDPEGAINAIPAVQPTVKPLVWENFDAWTYWARSIVGTYHVKERNGVWRATLETRAGDELVYEYTTDGLTPGDFEAALLATQADYEARILSVLDMQPTVSPDVIEIDLRSVMIEQIEEAASQSPWVPPEYAMNEIISDCCSFLRGPRDPSPDVAELPPSIVVRDAVRTEGHIAIRNVDFDDAEMGLCLIPIAHIDGVIAALARVKGVM